MKNSKALPLFKRKGFKIGVAVAVIICVGAVALFTLSPKKAIEVSTTITSATAESGSISTTVTGTGNLQAASTVNVTVPSGLEIDEVLVSTGDSVTTGQSLATVKKASVASALQEVNTNMTTVSNKLNSGSLTDLEKVEYNDIYSRLTTKKETLTTLYDTLTITATSDGIIGSINVSSGSETSSTSTASSSSSTSSYTASTASVKSNTSGGIMPLTASVSTKNSSSKDTASKETSSLTLLSTDEDTGSSDTSSDESSSETPTETQTITDFSALTIPSPVTGEEGITGIDSENTSGSGYVVSSITWNCNGAFAADTEYTATIELKALTGYQFTADATPIISGSVYNCQISANGSRMTITAKFAKTASDTNQENNSQSQANEVPSTSSNDTSAYDNMTGGSVDFGSYSYSGGDATVASSDTSSSTTTTDTYNTNGVTAFTIYGQDNYKISLSVDELDILSIKEGQTASITMDALSDQTFEGTVSKVGTIGSTSGSSTKYTIEITIPKDDNMRIGMSASATITISESENAVLIPLSALQEKGGKTYVYTSTDESGNLSGEVEVETGLSNSSQVEITSGLSEGDTVYYQETTSSSSSDDIMIFGDGSDMGGDMGGGPGGNDGNGGDMGGGPGGNGGGQATNN